MMFFTTLIRRWRVADVVGGYFSAVHAAAVINSSLLSHSQPIVRQTTTQIARISYVT